MSEALWLAYHLLKFVGSLVFLAIMLGLATGVLELHQSESFRRARAGWRAGRGKR